MIQAAARGRRATLGADKAYDAAEHIARLRAIGDQPTAPQAHRRAVWLDQACRRATQDPAWGLSRVGWMVTLTAAACNLVRLPKLLANAA